MTDDNGPSTADLGLIGNGRIAALVETGGRIVWWCFPRFDSNPVFSRLLSGSDEKGFTDIVLERQARARSSYRRNTAVIETELEDADGAKLRIIDFAPRFNQFGRIFHPAELVRRIEPITGYPRIRIRMRPTFDYGVPATARTLGSSHIRYASAGDTIRLTTDAPLSYVTSETLFTLTRPLTMIIGPDESIAADIAQTAQRFEVETSNYWLEWVRSLAIPFEWQQPVIRAAITLKLCSFDETGAIVAAHTTSIPESEGSGRNWDYRYCWLRDAHFVLQALNRLGATRTMERYLEYITNLPSRDGTLKPLYPIVPNDEADEWVAPDLQGYQGQGPVRVGNAAHLQSQHDVYGSVVLAAQQMFIDERLVRPGGEALFRRLERMANQASERALEPDAGIWEFRGSTRIHTHSAAMCWAACDRAAGIARRLKLTDRTAHWSLRANELKSVILQRAWNERRQSFTAAFDNDDLDASTLLLAELGLVRADDPRFKATIVAIERELVRDGQVMRYVAADDFGTPENAFIICRFWLSDALALSGRTEEARSHFEALIGMTNSFGLLSEDIDPKTERAWGNIPQTYSMAGLITTAMRLSRGWEDPWALV
jgi:GH15 family glucan-1,4-alpha-glucosidase